MKNHKWYRSLKTGQYFKKRDLIIVGRRPIKFSTIYYEPCTKLENLLLNMGLKPTHHETRDK